jgi:2-haloacid dehalogenase
MPAHDLGFRNQVYLDRGYDPDSPAYEYVRVETLDEVNTMLGI